MSDNEFMGIDIDDFESPKKVEKTESKVKIDISNIDDFLAEVSHAAAIIERATEKLENIGDHHDLSNKLERLSEIDIESFSQKFDEKLKSFDIENFEEKLQKKIEDLNIKELVEDTLQKHLKQIDERDKATSDKLENLIFELEKQYGKKPPKYSIKKIFNFIN